MQILVKWDQEQMIMIVERCLSMKQNYHMKDGKKITMGYHTTFFTQWLSIYCTWDVFLPIYLKHSLPSWVELDFKRKRIQAKSLMPLCFRIRPSMTWWKIMKSPPITTRLNYPPHFNIGVTACSFQNFSHRKSLSNLTFAPRVIPGFFVSLQS